MLAPAMQDRLNINTIDDMYAPIASGVLDLWVCVRKGEVIGAVITSIDAGSAGKICSVHCLAGSDLKQWVKQGNDAIKAYARAHRCTAIESITRNGWARLIPDSVETGKVYAVILEYKDE